MAKKGLIRSEVNLENRRENILHLTEIGESLISNILKKLNLLFTEKLQFLDSKELDVFERSLDKINDLFCEDKKTYI